MRLLLDACLPQRLRHEIPGHDVATAQYMGWGNLTNGELLAAMKANGFEGLITADSNLPHQQSIVDAAITIFVLRAATNRLVDLRPLLPELLRQISFARPGVVATVSGP
ncbi:MAG: hypothetical protein JNK76_18260 [Planctomycetales bacterium]|nr:hypothetical protein [Planctomycetales bacterium]MBN8627320.1 hypothetical protein [Planctomycetota bacterium]